MSSYKYKYMFIIYLHKYMKSCETILHEYENNYIFFKTLNIKPVKYEKNEGYEYEYTATLNGCVERSENMKRPRAF